MDSVSDIKLNGVDVEKIAQGVNTLWEKSVIEPFNVKNISQSVANVDWNTGADNRNLEYSEDKTTWTSVPYADGKYTLTIPVGKKYYVQGSSTNFGGWWGSDQDVEISGYVLSLHYPTMEQPSNQGVSYQKLFSNGSLNSTLHFDFSNLKLPVSRVAKNGYEQTFAGCASITELDSDVFYTDGSYNLGEFAFASMFKGCVNLTRVDGFNLRRFVNLPNWDELSSMFDACISLVYVSDDFFDTTLTPTEIHFEDKTCEYMFRNCSSLTHPPKLPSPRGRRLQFRNMFQGCTSLTNANTQGIMPNYTQLGMEGLRLGTEGIFQGMFYGCTGLTSMHDLSSYTMTNYGNSYFQNMYYGCTGITSIDTAKMPGGVATKNCFREMLRGCTGITTIPSGFIKPTNTAESCYQDMFNGCTGLTTIPSGLLTATTFSTNCCANMFYNCNHLTAIPSGFMSPTTVSFRSCFCMFENCTRLSSVASDILPATALAESCYEEMFKNTAITKAPTMVVTSVGIASCKHMYSDCPSLSDISGISLLATTLANECYRGMFYERCTSITTPLELPATTLAEGCYWGMYDGCVNLEGTVKLPAETLYHYSYATMFNGCNKLQGIEVNFKTWNSDYTYLWVDGITNSTGVFTCYDVLQQTTGASNIPVNWSVVNKTIPYLYFEDRSGAANTITCTKTGDQAEWLSLEYSTDWDTWSTYDLTQPLTIPANGRVYLRGSNTYGFGKDNSNYHTFTCSGNYALGGDLFSIMDGSVTYIRSRFMHRTFQYSTTLVDCSQLSIPELPMDTVAFTWAFSDCPNLVSVMESIPVTYWSSGGLNANSEFHQMFRGNSNQTNFPTFPNITVVHRDSMRYILSFGSTPYNQALEYVDLSNIETVYKQGLDYAFYNCESLEVVKIGISAWGDYKDSESEYYNNTHFWIEHTHPTGVFCKNSTLPVMRGSNYIPNNWSIADLNGKLYDPVITDNNGVVTIAEGGGGSSCSIYYTTDNTTPDTTSTLYTQPFARPANSVIKAIAVYSGNLASLVTNSDVAADYPITEMKFVRNTSMEANAANSKAITLLDTSTITSNNELEFRYKCQYAYDQSNGIVFTTGLFGNVGKHLWYMSGDKVYYNVGGTVKKQVNYNYKNVDMLDLTATFGSLVVNENYTYDNNTQTYVYQNASGGAMNGKLNIDVTSFKLHSIQIWNKSTKVLLFDGVAAMYNGQYGIYDKVSATLKTNSSITMVGEPYVQQACATPQIVFSEDLNECEQPAGTGTAEISCSTPNSTIYYKLWDFEQEEPDEWEQYDSQYVIDLYSGEYYLKAYATATGYSDSQTTPAFDLIVNAEEPCQEPDPCQECIDGCEGDPDCEQECYDTVC